MIGTLMVGALAYRAYGPEVESIAPLVDRARQVVAEAWSPASRTDRLSADSSGSPPPPEEFLVPVTPLAELNAPELLEDSAVQPAAAIQQGAPLAAANSAVSPVSVVIRELNERGVTEYSLNKWGSTGDFYRFHCSAPWGDDGRYACQFEAVAADPSEAAQQVLEKVAHWQASLRR